MKDIETLIRDANPARASDLPAGDSPHARRVLAQILREPCTTRRANGKVARIALAGAAVGGMAVVLVATLPGSPETNFQPTPVTVAALRSLAVLAAAQPTARPPGPGQSQYTASGSLSSTLNYEKGRYFTDMYRGHDQLWVAPNGAEHDVGYYSSPWFPTTRDRASWVAAGRPSLADVPFDQRSGPGTVSLPWMMNVQKLPTDPRMLAELISDRKIEGGPAGPAEDFAQISDLLRDTLISPALRAALFEVAAHTPGVEVLGAVKDQAGRRGIGVAYVSYPHSNERELSELIFDPATAGLLAEQTVTVNTQTHVRTLTGWTVYLATGVADSMSSVPAHTTIP